MARGNRRILVTGASGWWGARTAQRLAQEPGVADVLGVDASEPAEDVRPARFARLAADGRGLEGLVREMGADTVVHTVLAEGPSPHGGVQAANVALAQAVLAACAGAESAVRRIVVRSSTQVYGAAPDLPGRMREDRRIDRDPTDQLTRDAVLVEAEAEEFAHRNPETQVLVLRFADALCPEAPERLARHLARDPVPTCAGFDPMLQLIHADDCVEAMARAALRGPAGVYNIAAAKPAPLSRILGGAGREQSSVLPPAGGAALAWALSAARVASLSPHLLDLLRFGASVSTAKALRDLGFAAGLDTADAYAEFIHPAGAPPLEETRAAPAALPPALAAGEGAIRQVPRPHRRRPAPGR
ncbi:MAG: NAD-dependent epimerase/dehydratase family protein [Candidatus Dormibacteraeota bacterium]|nr:NAD-dependent epimerase/dehydratase family protein [Candidatus Dormibacteraeota bacterium]